MESWMIKTKEDKILVMDGHRIVVPLEARKSILYSPPCTRDARPAPPRPEKR